ncbi:hypothetical protein AB837_00257 [bacterium AB1]|nr:hypothetical protein AB837_00257 [bacterium AB1]
MKLIVLEKTNNNTKNTKTILETDILESEENPTHVIHNIIGLLRQDMIKRGKFQAKIQIYKASQQTIKIYITTNSDNIINKVKLSNLNSNYNFSENEIEKIADGLIAKKKFNYKKIIKDIGILSNYLKRSYATDTIKNQYLYLTPESNIYIIDVFCIKISQVGSIKLYGINDLQQFVDKLKIKIHTYYHIEEFNNQIKLLSFKSIYSMLNIVNIDGENNRANINLIIFLLSNFTQLKLSTNFLQNQSIPVTFIHKNNNLKIQIIYDYYNFTNGHFEYLIYKKYNYYIKVFLNYGNNFLQNINSTLINNIHIINVGTKLQHRCIKFNTYIKTNLIIKLRSGFSYVVNENVKEQNSFIFFEKILSNNNTNRYDAFNIIFNSSISRYIEENYIKVKLFSQENSKINTLIQTTGSSYEIIKLILFTKNKIQIELAYNFFPLSTFTNIKKFDFNKFVYTGVGNLLIKYKQFEFHAMTNLHSTNTSQYKIIVLYSYFLQKIKISLGLSFNYNVDSQALNIMPEVNLKLNQ